MATTIERKWSAPKRIQESRGLSPSSKIAIGATGHWSHCDIWLNVPNDWFGVGSVMVVFALQGSVRVRVLTVALSSITRSDADANRSMVLAGRVRSLPCDGFEVEVSGGVTTSVGTVYLECWGCDTAGDVTGSGSGPLVAAADDMANPTAPQELSYLFGFDGTTWDRLRSGQLGAAIGALTPFQMLNVIPTARYGSAAIVMLDGEGRELQLSQQAWLRTVEQQAPQAEDNTNAVIACVPKPLAVSTYCATLSTNKGAANAASAKGAAGNLYSVWAYNANGAARWLFLCDTAGVPVAGTASLVAPILVPAGGQVFIGEDIFGQTGVNFPTGIGLAMMTTVAGGTLATAAECFWTARLK